MLKKKSKKILNKNKYLCFSESILKNKKLEGMFTFQYVGINLIKHIITSFIEAYYCISIKIIYKLIKIWYINILKTYL